MLVTATQTAPPAPVATPAAASREAAPRVERARASANASAQEPRAKSTPAPAAKGSAQYRLVHDKELNRTFVQVVDRESGEEILRFPPEQLIRFIDNNIARNSSGSAAGLLVDRSI